MENTDQKYRYTLEHCSGNNKKKRCPACGHMTFVRYIDTETGEYLSEDIGRCDRECNCGYHKKPKDFFAEGGVRPEKAYWFPKPNLNPSPRPSSFSAINHALVEESMGKLAFNNFNIWLREHFDSAKAMEACIRYNVGGHNLWPNSTVFWQIDQQTKVHAGKIMLYDYHTGHRVKSPDAKVCWVHSLTGFKDFNLRQCLFGLHLLRPENETVAIVESEKTAVVASMFFPGTVFLATGGLTNLRPETCEPLKGKRVILFPDLGAEEIWREKAREIPGLQNHVVSNWLSSIATDEMRQRGLDIADVMENWNPQTSLNVEDFI